jgi:hypothetical protein
MPDSESEEAKPSCLRDSISVSVGGLVWRGTQASDGIADEVLAGQVGASWSAAKY